MGVRLRKDLSRHRIGGSARCGTEETWKSQARITEWFRQSADAVQMMLMLIIDQGSDFGKAVFSKHHHALKSRPMDNN